MSLDYAARIAELEAEKKIRLQQLSDVTLRMRELEAENSRLLKMVAEYKADYLRWEAEK